MFMADQVFDNATWIRYEHKHVFGNAIASSKIQREGKAGEKQKEDGRIPQPNNKRIATLCSVYSILPFPFLFFYVVHVHPSPILDT